MLPGAWILTDLFFFPTCNFGVQTQASVKGIYKPLFL